MSVVTPRASLSIIIACKTFMNWYRNYHQFRTKLRDPLRVKKKRSA